MKPLLFICAASLLLGAAAPARADAASTQLDLSASAQREVANDQLDATLYIEEQQTAPAPLADNLNRAGSAAMAAARAFPHVEATSGGYSSWPQYDKNGKITGWQGRTEIRLKSTDFVQSAELVAQLQKTMLLGSINFSVSDTTRKRVQQQMLPEAIRELQDTALIAAHALGKTRARVQALTIGNEGNAPRPMMMMATRSAPMDKVATPDWQAGKTQLQIQVSGKLELD